MENEGFSSAEFADTLGIGRPLLSHVLGGRNNPSLQLVMKILEHFPAYSADWLISGKDSKQTIETPGNEPEEKDTVTAIPSATPPAGIENRVSKSEPQRVLLFFADGTFEAYNSRK